MLSGSSTERFTCFWAWTLKNWRATTTHHDRPMIWLSVQNICHLPSSAPPVSQESKRMTLIIKAIVTFPLKSRRGSQHQVTPVPDTFNTFHKYNIIWGLYIPYLSYFIFGWVISNLSCRFSHISQWLLSSQRFSHEGPLGASAHLSSDV